MKYYFAFMLFVIAVALFLVLAPRADAVTGGWTEVTPIRDLLAPFDEWRAFADIDMPKLHLVIDGQCPGDLIACTTTVTDAQGNREAWIYISLGDSYWIWVHEFGHALGIAEHTDGVMGPYGGTEMTLTNVAQIRDLYPAYEHRLVVNY